MFETGRLISQYGGSNPRYLSTMMNKGEGGEEGGRGGTQHLRHPPPLTVIFVHGLVPSPYRKKYCMSRQVKFPDTLGI